jgi:hypothetical protein
VSDFTTAGTGYSFVPSPSVGAASWETWCGRCYLSLAAGGCISPDLITRAVVAQMPIKSLRALLAAGLLTSP